MTTDRKAGHTADEAKVFAAEKAIQKILLDLEQEVRGVDAVEVDCRRYANCGVSIFLVAQTKP